MAFIPALPSTPVFSQRSSFLPAISSRPCSTLVRRPARAILVCTAQQVHPVDDVFSIFKTVMPADSDYSTFLWHGAYIRWLEEARVLYLTHRKLPYEYLMFQLNTELPVRDLSIRYITPIRIGEEVEITTRLADQTNRVRITILYEFIRVSDGHVCSTAQVTLVPINFKTRAVHRKWPAELSAALLSV